MKNEVRSHHVIENKGSRFGTNPRTNPKKPRTKPNSALRKVDGEDWPLSYKDVAPYYDIVEEYVGITGILEGVYELPDGKFRPPMGLTCAETLLRNRAKAKLGRTVTLGRSANITKSIHGRAPCHYCGPYERGCVTHSYFNSAFTTVADALATGKCTLVSNAMAYKFQQSRDVKNLFVMDGAGFTSTACQNPTLNIMALCVRSCDYLLGEMKRGNI
jgi:choline dehydrogenase-like flavoprotein